MKRAAAGLLILLGLHAGAATFVVTNANDSGEGSLRDRMTDANTAFGEDVIQFDIPGSGVVHVISLASTLPIVSPQRLDLDGSTQPGYTNRPLIVLDGGSAAGATGLIISAAGCLLRGLAVVSFSNEGLRILSASNVVEGCHVFSNNNGIIISSTDNSIGGAAVSNRNVISGNRQIGVLISGAAAGRNVISMCYIGLNPAGTASLANGQDGARISQGDNNQIGLAGAGNIISGNGGDGVLVSTFAASNLVAGNVIGLDAAGSPAPNADDGVEIQFSSHNVIGGAAAGEGNVIAGNGNRGIFIQNVLSSNNAVIGNRIGLDAADVARSNTAHGIHVLNAADTQIGGTNAAARNVISGNGGSGITVSNSSDVVIEGNYIGVASAGASDVPNSLFGIDARNSTNLLIGGTVAGSRNIVSGNLADGIFVSAAVPPTAVIQGNYVGTSADGLNNVSNKATGIHVNGIGILIGGDVAGAGNVASGNGGAGIVIDGVSSGNVVRGNMLGVGANGATPLGNGSYGVSLGGTAHDNLVGGTNALQRNIISGNAINGMFINGDRNVIIGNYIGLDSSGSVAVSNRNYGIRISNGDGNEIGGVDAGMGNVISGNDLPGVRIDGHTNIIEGNIIGLNASGSARIDNLGGVEITSGLRNRVGGATPAQRNVISGSFSEGIEVDGSSTGTVIQGNYIGTDVTGSFAISNRFNGILLSAAVSNLIGGAGAGEGNLISGNGLDGIRLLGNANIGNFIQGNLIGTDVSGSQPIGNTGDGVSLIGAINTRVGGTNLNEGNVIAHNRTRGVSVFTNTVAGSGRGNAILGNLIYSNALPGIDLILGGASGVTTNDPAPDADNGPNNLQNFPVMTAVTQGSSIIRGTLISGTSQTYRCEFFATNVPQGIIFLGATNLVTSPGGTATFFVVLAATAPTSATVFATATDTNGNTSEFGPGVIVKAAADGDGDGLWDAWEVLHFGSNVPHNGAGDPDGDGFNNYFEFVSDTQPTNANSFFRLDTLTNNLPHFPRWVSSVARWYDVETSTNLLAPVWSNLAANVVGAGGVQSLADAADATSRSYRVRVKVP